MTIEELPHTADVMFRVTAPDKSDLFSESVRALMLTMYGTGNQEKTGFLTRTVDLEASDDESLLQEFLSEVLYISEVDNLVFSEVHVDIRGTHLSAILEGRPFDPAMDSSGTEVKGISFSGLHILKEGGVYVLDIIFDV